MIYGSEHNNLLKLAESLPDNQFLSCLEKWQKHASSLFIKTDYETKSLAEIVQKMRLAEKESKPEFLSDKEVKLTEEEKQQEITAEEVIEIWRKYLMPRRSALKDPTELSADRAMKKIKERREQQGWLEAIVKFPLYEVLTTGVAVEINSVTIANEKDCSGARLVMQKDMLDNPIVAYNGKEQTGALVEIARRIVQAQVKEVTAGAQTEPAPVPAKTEQTDEEKQLDSLGGYVLSRIKAESKDADYSSNTPLTSTIAIATEGRGVGKSYTSKKGSNVQYKKEVFNAINGVLAQGTPPSEDTVAGKIVDALAGNQQWHEKHLFKWPSKFNMEVLRRLPQRILDKVIDKLAEGSVPKVPRHYNGKALTEEGREKAVNKRKEEITKTIGRVKDDGSKPRWTGGGHSRSNVVSMLRAYNIEQYYRNPSDAVAKKSQQPPSLGPTQ